MDSDIDTSPDDASTNDGCSWRWRRSPWRTSWRRWSSPWRTSSQWWSGTDATSRAGSRPGTTSIAFKMLFYLLSFQGAFDSKYACRRPSAGPEANARRAHVSSRSGRNSTFTFLARCFPFSTFIFCKKYPFFQAIYPDLAGKVTGMLLDIDNAEILHMLVDHNSLREQV